MSEKARRWALGLMSGTSLDGIDAALTHSDGREAVEAGALLTVPYEPEFRARLFDTSETSTEPTRATLSHKKTDDAQRSEFVIGSQCDSGLS